jgi:hypothetical protein
MHSAAASQSKLCELGSLVLTSMVRDHGQGEKQRVERKKKELTSRPGAYLAGMAGQCPRGRPGAAEGRLHRGATGSTAIGASTGVHSLTEVSSKSIAGVGEEAGGMSRSVATVKQNPERDLTMDLLGEEAAGDATWRSWWGGCWG